MTDSREEQLHRLAYAKSLAVSVTRSTSRGMNLVEIWIGDPMRDGRGGRVFYTFEHAKRYLDEKSDA